MINSGWIPGRRLEEFPEKLSRNFQMNSGECFEVTPGEFLVELRRNSKDYQRNSWRKTPDKFFQKIPEGISEQNLRRKFLMKSLVGYLEKISVGIPGATPRKNWWRKSPKPFLEKIPGDASGGNPRSNPWNNFWTKSSKEPLDERDCYWKSPGEVSGVNSRGISGGNFCRNCWYKSLKKYLKEISAGRNFLMKSPEEILA